MPLKRFFIDDWIRFYGRLYFKDDQWMFAQTINNLSDGFTNTDTIGKKVDLNEYKDDDIEQKTLFEIKCTNIVLLKSVDISLIERVCKTIEDKKHLIKKC